MYELKMAHRRLIHNAMDDDCVFTTITTHLIELQLITTHSDPELSNYTDRTATLGYRLSHTGNCFKFSQSDFDIIESHFRFEKVLVVSMDDKVFILKRFI
jgi:hypothetical protein